MRAFCRIAELKSFSKAAEDLGVSAALLSRETKILEESLGCLLLARTTRSMSLTEHGQRYYTEVRRILEELDLLDQTIRNNAEVLKGNLRINAPQSFGLAVLSNFLPQFMTDYPELSLSLVFDDRVLDMIEGGFDITIRIRESLPDSGLLAHKIGEVRQQLFASPSYLNRQGRPEAPDDLPAHQLLSFSLASHSSNWALNGKNKTVDIPVKPKTAVNNSLFLKDLLAAGQGIGALPSFISEPAVREGLLERVLPDYALPNRTIFAVVATRLGKDAKTRAFLDGLDKYLSAADSKGIFKAT